ncbi:MAG: Gfo/Idh/MocA family oxidoreductase [Bacteroidota bacterium]
MDYDQFRRKAIKKVSLGLGGLLLTPANLFANKNPLVKKLGVALVGLGNYSTKQLGPALQETELCYLAGIVTGTPEKAKTWADKYSIDSKNIFNYQNFDDIKNNPDIDIIYVVLPNFMHAEYTIRAAEAGKHVICEKPLAMNVVECERMLSACKKANVNFGVGYRLYYEPHHIEARRLGTNKVFGDIKLIESSLGFTRPSKDSWRLDAKKGGGAIMDLGIYAIQGARRTIGESPISVTAQAFNFDKEHFKGIYETVLWQFEFPNGIVANCSTTYSAYVDRLYVTCKKGWFGLSPAYNAVGTKGNTIQGDMSFKSKSYQQIDQLDDFAYAVLNDKKPKATGEEGLEDIRLIEKILKAVATGEKIKIAKH